MAGVSGASSLPYTSLVSESDLLTLVEWDTEKYGIGVRAIDEQHKILILLANELTNLYTSIVHPHLAHHSAMSSQSSLVQEQSSSVASPSTRSLTSQLAKAALARVHALHHASAEVEGKAGGGSKSRTHLFAAGLVGQPSFPVVGNRQFDPRLQRGSDVAKVVEDLMTYTCKYLLVEDHLLDTYAYVDRAMQQQDHELFASEVAFALKLSEEHNCQIGDIRRLLVFLRLWLTGHIPRDRKYAPMLIEKGVGM